MPVPHGKSEFSRTWTFFEGDWHQGNAPIFGPRTHAAWLGSVVFDGGRVFEGVSPDLDLHLARVNVSAEHMLLAPCVPLETWLMLATDGIKRFEPRAELYVRPMYWAESGPPGGIRHDPDTTRWCLCIYEAPLPKPAGTAITLSPYRRPAPDAAPVEAKASCLYPNNSRAIIEAQARGFDNCLVRDGLGHIAELASANIFMTVDGVVYTPVPNGTFLNGITRQRVIKLLRDDGLTVAEQTLGYSDFLDADEIFSTSNFSKLSPVTRIDQRTLQIGPIFCRARQLYWDFAHSRVRLAEPMPTAAA